MGSLFSCCKYTCLESQRAAEVCSGFVTAPFPPLPAPGWCRPGTGQPPARATHAARSSFLSLLVSARMGMLRYCGNSSMGCQGCLGGAEGVSSIVHPTCTLHVPCVPIATSPCVQGCGHGRGMCCGSPGTREVLGTMEMVSGVPHPV